jgi:hypothetical protein
VKVSVRGLHPRDDPSIVESDDEIHAHTDVARDALDGSNDARVVGAKWHAVNYPDDTFTGMEVRLENKGVISISTGDLVAILHRCNPPESVLLPTE